MNFFKYIAVNIITLCIVAGFQQFEDIQQTIEVRGVIENTINTTLNQIKDNLTDPISIPTKCFDFGEDEALSGSFNVTSLKIGGVKNFVAKEIEVNVESQKIYMKISIPELTIHFKYWADMVLLNLVPLYGRGRMGVNFDEVVVEIEAIGTTEENMKIKDIVLLFSLSEATFDLNGLINNPEYSALISSAVTDNFANFVNHNSKIISETISPIVETIINSILEPTSKEVRVNVVKVHVNA